MAARGLRLWLLIGAFGLAGAGLTWRHVLEPWTRSESRPTAKTSSRAKKSRRPTNKAPAPVAHDESGDNSAPVASTEHGAVDPLQHGIRGHIFAILDQRRAGSLAAEELPEEFRGELMKADANGDGRLQLAEFLTALEHLRLDELPPPHDGSVLLTPPADGKPIPVYNPAGADADPLPDWFRKLDRDGDRQIGLYEWPADQLERFRKLDRDRDGFLSADEAGTDRTASPISSSP